MVLDLDSSLAALALLVLLQTLIILCSDNIPPSHHQEYHNLQLSSNTKYSPENLSHTFLISNSIVNIILGLLVVVFYRFSIVFFNINVMRLRNLLHYQLVGISIFYNIGIQVHSSRLEIRCQ